MDKMPPTVHVHLVCSSCFHERKLELHGLWHINTVRPEVCLNVASSPNLECIPREHLLDSHICGFKSPI